MLHSSLAAALLAAGLLTYTSANAQPATGSVAADATGSQKQATQGDGPTVVGPASGAYKETSDPKGWDAEAKAWHKQHTDGRDSIGFTDQQEREGKSMAKKQ